MDVSTDVSTATTDIKAALSPHEIDGEEGELTEDWNNIYVL